MELLGESDLDVRLVGDRPGELSPWPRGPAREPGGRTDRVVPCSASRSFSRSASSWSDSAVARRSSSASPTQRPPVSPSQTADRSTSHHGRRTRPAPSRRTAGVRGRSREDRGRGAATPAQRSSRRPCGQRRPLRRMRRPWSGLTMSVAGMASPVRHKAGPSSARCKPSLPSRRPASALRLHHADGDWVARHGDRLPRCRGRRPLRRGPEGSWHNSAIGVPRRYSVPKTRSPAHRLIATIALDASAGHAGASALIPPCHCVLRRRLGAAAAGTQGLNSPSNGARVPFPATSWPSQG